MKDQIWSTQNVQKNIMAMNGILENFTLDKTFNFLSTKQIFSRLSATERIYFKVDQILSGFQDSTSKAKLSLVIINLMLMLIVIRQKKLNEITDIESFNKDVNQKLSQIIDHVIQKNRKYGNSALNPIRIISNANKIQQLYVRLDDKLNRVMNRQDDEDQDLPFDIAGYFILIYVCLKLQDDK